MAVHIAGLTVPGPTDVLGTARTALGWGERTVRLAVGLPDRAVDLLTGVEVLLARINYVAKRVEELVDRIDAIAEAAAQTVVMANAVADGASAVLDRANAVTDSATLTSAEALAVVTEAARISGRANELLAAYQPIAERAAPLASAFVNELSAEEVAAAVRLVDQLPQLAEHLESDVMPVMAALDRVGPDVTELLTVVKDLRHAITGIPGLTYLRRRGASSGP